MDKHWRCYAIWNKPLKDKYCTITLNEVSKAVRIRETESSKVDAKD